MIRATGITVVPFLTTGSPNTRRAVSVSSTRSTMRIEVIILVPYPSSIRSTTIVQWVASAAIAPIAAQTGSSTAPITPIVSGNSARTSRPRS